jgi:hypothetical protein
MTIYDDATPRHPEYCGLWQFHKRGAAARRYANAYAAASQERVQKRPVWLPIGLGSCVLLSAGRMAFFN